MTRRPRATLLSPVLAVACAVAIGAPFAPSGCGGDDEPAREAQVPSVEGKLYDDAVNQVKAAGFEPEVKREPDPTPRDLVLSQDPAAFKLAEEGSKVTLVVSSGP
jgi:beta-lactam-binding protein with PASTA domain